MQFLQGPRPNSGDLQLVKLSGNHRSFSTSKRRGNHAGVAERSASDLLANAVILAVSIVCLLRCETKPLRHSMNITLIVCRLIVVTIQVWESDFSLRKSSVWLLIAKAPRRTRILARGIGRTCGAASELRGRCGAWGAERSPGEHHQASSGTLSAAERAVYKLPVSRQVSKVHLRLT